MRYSEFAGKDLFEDSDPKQTGHYDPEEDKFNRSEMSDTRRPRLTLRHINKLKKLRATKDLENAKKEGLLGVMYGLDANADDEM
jgi:hypothetical protein